MRQKYAEIGRNCDIIHITTVQPLNTDGYNNYVCLWGELRFHRLPNFGNAQVRLVLAALKICIVCHFPIAKNIDPNSITKNIKISVENASLCGQKFATCALC